MNELNRHKKSDKIKWAFTAIAFVLIAVMLVGLCMQVFAKDDKFKPSTWFKADKYELEWGSKADVVANPGTWYYMADGKESEDYELESVPTYKNGVITLSFKSTEDPAVKSYQLRYQPEYEVGDTYTVTFTVTVSAEATLTLGCDGKTQNETEIKIGKDYKVTYEGTVDLSNPFFIQLKGYDNEKPITLIVKNIKFVNTTQAADEAE